MHRQVGDVRVHGVEHGGGVPLVLLHGAGVDHREPAGALEPVLAAHGGTRRVYVDLPGHGLTPAPDRVRSNDDVVDLLVELCDQLAGAGPFLLAGHSLGAYLARAVAARRADRVAGIALLCPVGASTSDTPPHVVVRSEGDPEALLDPADVADYRDYLVVQTPATARLYRERVVPGARLADTAALERVLAGWVLRDEPREPQPYPALVVAGRQDASAGWTHAAGLLPLYPRATLAVVDGAGHALWHEQPAVLAALLHEWLVRCGVTPPG